jgi:ribosomal protein S18 acetylase RimI-like enzyme
MITIREEIFPEDLNKIRTVLKGTGFFDAAPDEIDVAAGLVEEVLANGNSVENYKILIAEENASSVGQNEIAGYVCFARVPCSVSTYEIYWIAVNKNIQGKGTGRHLINEVEKIVKQLHGSKLILYTAGRALYAPTHKFYKACGFKEEARIKNYYSIGDDCVIYSKIQDN